MADWNLTPGLNVGLFLAFTQGKIDGLGKQRGCLLRSVLLKSIFQKAAELEQRGPNAHIRNDGAVEIFHPGFTESAWNLSRPASVAWSPALLGDLEEAVEPDFEDLDFLSQQGDGGAQGSLSAVFSILRLVDEQPQEYCPDSSDDAPTAPSDAVEAGTLSEDSQASFRSQRQSAEGAKHAEEPELPEQADMAPARAETPWMPPLRRSSPGSHGYQLFSSMDETAEASDEVALPDVDHFGFGVPSDI